MDAVKFSDPSFWISVITFVFAVFIYFYHDKKIKSQERLLNQYALDRVQKEQTKEKQASLFATIKDGSRDQKLEITNKGLSIARNVSIEPVKIEGIFIMTDLDSFELQPGQSMEFKLIVAEGTPDLITVTLKWDDDFAISNKISFQLLT